MAGGSLTITVDTYAQAPDVFKRVLCWASTAANKMAIRTDRSASGTVAIVVPEANFGVGSLVLKRAGTDLVAGYVAGSNISYNIGNGGAVEQNVNTCPSSAAQPTVTSFATNVGGNPLAVSLVYANVVASGLVDIFWGDGTSTLGAAESGTEAHTYPRTAVYQVRIVDATVSTDVASFYVDVNSTL